MITMEETKMAVVALLNTQNLKVYGSEIKQGFKRPCFFMQIMPIQGDPVTKGYSEEAVTVEINFFPAESTDLENVKMYDILRVLFSKPLTIGNRKILPRNIRMDNPVDDNRMGYYSMSFRFDLNYFNDIPNNQPDPEIMQELNLNMKEGNT